MKKGEVTLAVIVLIIVIIVFVGWMMREGWKECRSNRDCGETEYCGADFSCHEYKIVQVPSPSDRTTSTAWIIGIAIIIAAIILKWDSIFRRGHASHGNEHHHEEEYRTDKRGLFEEETGDEENLIKQHGHH